MKRLRLFMYILMGMGIATGCQLSAGERVDIRPHPVVPQADSIYRQAIALMQASYDVDSTRKCIRLLDAALFIDSLNPDYYGLKAKLLSEMGELDAALTVQEIAVERRAMTGEYWLQLGLFQAAKEREAQAHESFEKSRTFLQEVLKQYPDSLGAFILCQASNALYQKNDSLFFRDIDDIRKKFKDRLMEIEMTRRVKPQSLIKQIKDIQINKEYNIDFDLDSLVLETAKKEERQQRLKSK